MRLIRVLVYEGEEQTINHVLGHSLISEGEDRTFVLHKEDVGSQYRIKEVFRGILSEPGKVLHASNLDGEELPSTLGTGTPPPKHKEGSTDASS